MSNIPFAVPDITDSEIEAVANSLRSGWITTGPQTKIFEKEFAKNVGGAHGVAVNSCTAAMHLALEAIGIGADDEIILPTMTFAATGEVVRYMGAKPILVDVLPGSHNIDYAGVEKAINERTKAVIPVHFGGQAVEMDAICSIAKKHNLKVIEDAAHAFPAFYKGKRIGSISDITCFSFYATKTITTAEGGMAVTDNEEWADRMRVMSLHGISKDAWKRYTAEGSWYYEIVAPGYKYNMTDIAAAMGLVQLERAYEMLDRRREIARFYTESLSGLDAVELLDVEDFDSNSWHLFVIKLVEGKAKIVRNELIEALKKEGIGTSVHFIPLHMHPYYRETYGYKPEDLPVAKDIFDRCLSLPIYPGLSEESRKRVVDCLLSLV